MGLRFRQIKAYARLVFTGAIVLVVLLIIFMNRKNEVPEVWLFKTYKEVNVLWLILVTAGSSVVSVWVLSRLIGAWREFSKVRRERHEAARLQEQKRLARELEEKERRIDEKMRRSITEET